MESRARGGEYPRSERMEEGTWAVGNYRPKAQGVN